MGAAWALPDAAASAISEVRSEGCSPWGNRAQRAVNKAMDSMHRQRTIEAKLRDGLAPAHLQVINESHMHSVPPGSETHFKVVVVSDRFAGMPRVRRHQTVNGLLAAELAAGLHALSLSTLTPAEWQARDGAVLASPPCHGGSKREH